MASFDENGKYIKTNWKAGDKISSTKLNKIEESIEAVNDNDISRHVEADARLDALEAKDVAHDKELTKIKNDIADNKAAAELGDYDINSRMTFLENELNEGIEEVHNVASTVDGKIAAADASMKTQVNTAKDEMTTQVNNAKSEMATQVNNAKSNMTAQVNTAKDEMTAQVNTAKNEMTSQVNSAMNVMNTAQTNMQSMVEHVESEIFAFETRIEGDWEGLHAKDAELSEQLTQNTSDIENLGTRIEGEIAKIDSQFNTIYSEYVKTVNGQSPDSYGNISLIETAKQPTFVNSISDCTDTSKVYVLPDGYMYAYTKTTEEGKYTANFTNVFDKNDCQLNTRLSSSGPAALNGYILTGGIDYPTDKLTHRIRCRNTTLGENNTRIQVYNPGVNAWSNINYTSVYPHGIDENNDYYFDFQDGNVSKIRIAFYNGTDEVITQEYADKIIVTIDEPITYTYEEGTTTLEWKNTNLAYNQPQDYEHKINNLESVNVALVGKIDSLESEMDERVTKLESGINTLEIPNYWQEHIESKINTIKSLQNIGGRNCFSFALITDSHYPSNLGKKSPILAKHIMDKCNIKYLLHCGDAQTRGCKATKEEILEENKNINEMFAPVKDRMLFVEGNHEGSYATINNVTYAKQLTESEIFEEYYRKVGFVGDIHFSNNCNAYYIDDTANKVRYIGLNSQNVPNSPTDVNADGTAKYNRFRTICYTQEQFDFLSNEALVTGLDDKWNVVIFAHIGIWVDLDNNPDYSSMTYLLWAYQNRQKYVYEYVGSDTWNSISLNLDFTNAKGRLVGFFAGHNHKDQISTPASNVQCITTRCDAKEENTTELNSERVLGTITEQSFDIFTVNKSERKVYITKIGAGVDRTFTY